MCIYVYVCACDCVCMYICLYMCMWVCMYMYLWKYVCLHIWVHVCEYVCVYMHLCGDTCHSVYLCRSAKNLSESVSSFYLIILGTELGLSGLGKRYLYILNYLSGSRLSSKPLLTSVFFSNVHWPSSRSTKILLFRDVLCEQIALDNW